MLQIEENLSNSRNESRQHYLLTHTQEVEVKEKYAEKVENFSTAMVNPSMSNDLSIQSFHDILFSLLPSKEKIDDACSQIAIQPDSTGGYF